MRLGDTTRHLRELYTGFYAYAAVKIRVAAWIGVFALPGYYYIWIWISPQPYDNIWLRLLGSALCLAVISVPYWPPFLARWGMPVTYITTLYCLPFFIAYMTLSNGATQVWQLTSIAAVLYVVFLFDILNALIASIAGVCLATATHLIWPTGIVWQPSIWAFLFVLFFAVLSVVFLHYSENLVVSEKLNAASSMAGQVAHELRTPLAAIRLETEKLEQVLRKEAEALAPISRSLV